MTLEIIPKLTPEEEQSAYGLCVDKGPVVLEAEVANVLLDAAGAPSGPTVAARIIDIARRWKSRVGGTHAGGAGCQCRQCHAASKVLRRAMELDLK